MMRTQMMYNSTRLCLIQGEEEGKAVYRRAGPAPYIQERISRSEIEKEKKKRKRGRTGPKRYKDQRGEVIGIEIPIGVHMVAFSSGTQSEHSQREENHVDYDLLAVCLEVERR